jgi:hypothetical protein
VNFNTLAVIVIAHRRLDGLKRVLASIEGSNVPASLDVRLVISVDGDPSEQVRAFVKNYRSQKFATENIIRTQNLGLREHLLVCGDMSENYDGIIVIEDDSFVADSFLYFAAAAIEYSLGKEKIAGISLYSYEWNELAAMPFQALRDGSDAYLMQVVSSWGQAWTRSQWQAFRSWYSVNTVLSSSQTLSLPEVIADWPKSSWKKYFSAYLIERDLYFLYPYDSYSTNFSDPGGIHRLETHALQVAMKAPNDKKLNFNFVQDVDDSIRYDAYMEPDSDRFDLVFEGKKITPIIDFTGAKNLSLYDADEFVVTTTQPDEYIKSFSICMRPIELNIMFESHRNSTNYIYLTHIKHINKKRRASVRARLLMHMYGDIMSSFRVIIKLALSRIWKR